MLIKQLINVETVRTDNLKFRTDLWDQFTDGWSVSQQMIVYKGRLLKKSSHGKCTTWLSNIAFHLQPIWLETLVAIDSASYLKSFSSFCLLPSEVTVLFNSNLSRCPFLRQLVDLDLLICTGFNLEHAVLLLCHIFTQGPRSQQGL